MEMQFSAEYELQSKIVILIGIRAIDEAYCS